MSTRTDDHNMPIAIVGMGCRLPGGADSPDKLWEMLSQKKSARSETPLSRFNIDAFYHPNGSRNGSINNRGGHFLDQDISAFDAPFFSISRAEAISMDPMQRILLEVTYEALENGGIPLSQLSGSETGCFVGCFTQDYDEMAKRDAEVLPKYHSIGTGKSILSNRISFCFDLKGPSMTLDTACSSSLVALHLACQSLRSGESTTAIVGATNLIISPDIMVGMTNLGFLSADSISYAFDSRANGYARGEGVAALILKPLHDALRDGDVIRSVIRGTAVNSNGRTPGITLPSRDAQVSLIRSAYKMAGLEDEFATTAYVEAHGTGTSAGDPIEANAIGAVLGTAKGRSAKLHVGSIKTNVGHLEGASGLAGLIKAVLSVESGVILPNIWFERGNPNIDFDGLNINVPTEMVEWPVEGVRRASINGFGYGGTNGHVIVDDAYHYLSSRGLKGNHRTRVPASHVKQNGVNGLSNGHTHAKFRLFPLSANDSTALVDNAQSLAKFLEEKIQSGGVSEEFLDDLAWTLSKRRSQLEYRQSIVATTAQDLMGKLNAQLASTRFINSPPKLAFIFTGQGAQWWGMGRELVSHPRFKQTLDLCNTSLQELGSSWSLPDELMKDEVDSLVNQAPISQPLCTAIQIALVDLFASWGVRPWRVAGHSSGEIAAAYALGTLTLDSAMRVSYYRGLLAPKIRKLGYDGGMLAVGLSEVETLAEIEALDDASGKVVVACVNSPRSTTVSGDVSALTELQAALTSRGVFARKLLVDTAYHSHHMLAISEEYKSYLSNHLEVAPISATDVVGMFSSVKARKFLPGELLDAAYWVENMVSPVRFYDAVAELCGEATQSDQKLLLVELGPHSALAGPVKQIVATLSSSSAVTYQSCLVRGKDASNTAHSLAGSLLDQGFPVDMYPGSSRQPLTDLPPYRWNHTRKYWSESRINRDYRLRAAPRTDLLGAPTSDWNPLEPRWRGFIRLAEQPWVADHVIQGAILYPAAGFCCMALQAAAQFAAMRGGGPITEYQIREMSISRALVVPQDDDGVEVVFSLRPAPMGSVSSSDTWNEFRIFSNTDAGDWTEHCRGLVSVGRDPKTSILDKGLTTNAQEAQRTCITPVDVAQLYEGLDAVGLSYGPGFRSIKSLIAGSSNEVMGTLQVTDTKRGMPGGHEFDRLVHPTTMDAMLQLCIVALCKGDIRNLEQAFVPTFVKEVTVSGQIDAPAGRLFSAAAKTQAHGFRDVVASVTIHDQDTFMPVIRMDGVKCRAIASSGGSLAASKSAPLYKHIGRILLEPDVDLLTFDHLNTLLRNPLKNTTHVPRIRDLEFLTYSFIHAVLKEVDASEKANMQSHHVKFYEYMETQHQLVLENRHEQQTDEWTRLGDADVISRLDHMKEELSREGDYEGRMILRMGHALPGVLRGEIDPLALMMDDDLLHDYYRVGLGVMHSYPQIAEYIRILSHKNPNLEYLEIGAGTGGCTRPVLDALSGSGSYKYPRLKSYLYTDISAGFFDKAEAWLRPDWGRLVEFKKLNIEEDPESQGFGQVDVIIAANVLHATKDINRTLENTRKLLRPGGKLVLLDMSHKLLSVAAIFGNLPGWWLSTEEWREQSPLLNEQQWRSAFLQTGFGDLEASSPDLLNPLDEGTRLLIATAVEPAKTPINGGVNGSVNGVTNGLTNGLANGNINGLKEHQKLIVLRPHTPSPSENTLIQSIEAKLDEEGIKPTVCSFEDLDDADLNATPIISLVELEQPWLQDISQEDLGRLQKLTQTSSGIIWVTRGAVSTKPELSVFHGLARSLRAEDEGRRYVSVDFSEPPLPDTTTCEMILSLYKQHFVDRSKSSDNEFIEKDGMLWIKRLVQDDENNQRVAERTRNIVPEPKDQDIAEQREQRPLKLQARTIGTIDSLAFTDDEAHSQPISPGQVEIEVQAVGLNFRDVLITLGEVTDDYLGNECSGIITKVHDDVSNVAVGDRVAAWCLGSFATRLRCPSNRVQRIADEMSYSTAASVPLVYVTAYHSLVNIARLRRGESVLIHAGAGGVGQAAIQVAKMCGAEVYATVGSAEKKEHLASAYGIRQDHIFNSRDLSFVQQIQLATQGRGVDVVLNSLSGDALQATWTQLLAPFGRFIELGKRDIDSNGRLEMSPYAKNAMFAAVDVTHLWREHPVLAGEILADVFERFREGLLSPVRPILVEPFSRVREAFRLMQSGRHMGKIVLEFRQDDLCQVVPRPLQAATFPEDATYLLAGGLGGLGRSISRWMVERGARNLVYISRSGASSAAAKELIEELHQFNVKTVVLACDITDTEKVSEALNTALEALPPLRGVIQGAMVLNDAVFANITHNSFISTLRPKVQGSWALHRATLDRNAPLDFFLMLSSVAAMVGNAGQSNYVAGCTYQSALAKHRQMHGLPATAIDIGKVAGVGFVAESGAGTVSEANLMRLGMPDISEAELLTMLEIAINSESITHYGGEQMVAGIADITKPGPNALNVELPFWVRDPVFSHLPYARPQSLQDSEVSDNGGSGNKQAELTIRQLTAKLDEISEEEMAERVLAALSGRLARALMIPAEEVDPVKSPANLGADSLVAIELRNWLSREGDVQVPVFDILQAPSLLALASIVLKLVKAQLGNIVRVV